jgi:rubredoxin
MITNSCTAAAQAVCWIRIYSICAPSNPFAPGTGFSDIAGDFVCAACTAINNTNINSTAFNAGDKLLHVFWTGVKYAVTDNLDVIGAYYHYDQAASGAPVNRRPHVLTGQWRLGEQLPQSEHDRSDGWAALPLLRNLQAGMSHSPL